MKTEKREYRSILYNDYYANQSIQHTGVNTIAASRSYYNTYFLNKFLPDSKNAKILDLGCGYGAMLISLKDLGYLNFTGVDNSQEAVKLLSSTEFSNKIIQADVVNFLEQSVAEQLQWDVILAIDILEHFSKNELVYILDLLNTVLTPGGLLIIKIPNAQSPLAGTTVFGDFTHEIAVTPMSLSQVLKACGFADVKSYEAHPIPYTLNSLIRFCLWKIIRLYYTFLYAIETGNLDMKMIWTRSFFAVANKI